MNGTSFNRRMFAGAAAGAVLAIAASADFVASATVTPADSTITQAGNWSWDISDALSNQFIPTLDNRVLGQWSGDASFSGSLVSTYHGSIGWDASLTFRGVNYTNVYAELGFVAETNLEARPFEVFGFIPFTGTVSWSAEGERIHGPLGEWSVASNWSNDLEGQVDRGAILDGISTPAVFRMEPSQYVSVDDTKYIDAYSYLTASLVLSEDSLKTQLFVGDAVWREEINIEMVPQLSNALGMSIDNRAFTLMVANKTIHASANWSSDNSLELIGSELFSGFGDWQHGAIVNIAAQQTSQISMDLGKFSMTFGAESFRIVSPTVDLGIQVTFTIEPQLTHRPQETWFANQQQLFIDNSLIKISYTLKGSGEWASNAQYSVDDRRVRHNYTYQGVVNADASVAWSIDPRKTRHNYTYQGVANWAPDFGFTNSESATYIYHLWQGEGDWSVDSQVDLTPWRTVQAAPSDWNVLGGNLFMAAVLKTFIDGEFQYAPAKRQFTIAPDDRSLIVAADKRRFDVTGRAPSFSV